MMPLYTLGELCMRHKSYVLKICREQRVIRIIHRKPCGKTDKYFRSPKCKRKTCSLCVCVFVFVCLWVCVCVCIWSDVCPVITHPCITVHSVKRWGLRYLLPARKKITMHRGRPCFPCTDSSCGNMCFTLCAAGPVLLSAGDSACESFWWTSEQPSSRRKVKFLGFRVLLDEVWGI